jgi:hypothetical protein
MYDISDLQAVFHIWYVGMFIVYVKCKKPSSNCSLIIAIKPKAMDIIRKFFLFFYILQNSYRNGSCIFSNIVLPCVT